MTHHAATAFWYNNDLYKNNDLGRDKAKEFLNGLFDYIIPLIETGKELYSFNVGSGIVSSPITWEQNGEQYIAVVSGWGGAVPLWGGEVAKAVKLLNQGGSVHVFKLHK